MIPHVVKGEKRHTAKIRRDDCRYYSLCLECAFWCDWEDFTCLWCADYEPLQITDYERSARRAECLALYYDIVKPAPEVPEECFNLGITETEASELIEKCKAWKEEHGILLAAQKIPELHISRLPELLKITPWKFKKLIRHGILRQNKIHKKYVRADSLATYLSAWLAHKEGEAPAPEPEEDSYMPPERPSRPADKPETVKEYKLSWKR